jgi:hypothetical protein
MRHAPFLKVTSRELRAGRMVDVGSVSVCHCGKRFSTEKDLEAHVLRPITEQIGPVEANQEELIATPAPVEVALARDTQMLEA